MILRDFIANAPEEDLTLRGVNNPTSTNPKKMYADIYFSEGGIKSLDVFKRKLRGGLSESNRPMVFIDDADPMQRNAMKISGTNSAETWILVSAQENLQPKMTAAALIAVMASVVSDLMSGKLAEKDRELLADWAKFIRFVEDSGGSTNRADIAVLIGHCRTLDEKIAGFLTEDSRGGEEVLPMFSGEFTVINDLTKHFGIILQPDELEEKLENASINQQMQEESCRMELVTHLAASMTQNLLLLGPPGTGKTYIVQRSISHIPVVQVSLEGSTEPETVVANIAQTPDGKFQAFLAETAKALKLGMLLAIVERLRQGRSLNLEDDGEAGGILTVLGKLPKNSKIADLLPAARKNGTRISDDLKLILGGISSSIGNEKTLKAWLAVLDAYADPFALDRWDEILYVYQNLEAHAVGTTCVLNIEEIYHAVENRKILDLLINLMAGQKKLPLSKAGVVGGDLFGFNVSVFATGNPIHETYLPQALESRFGFKEFLGYPDDQEEKRRMKETLEEYQNPSSLSLNLVSTKLDDFPAAVPLAKKALAQISDDLRDKIYNLVNWTRSMYDNQELRNCADPRMSKMWELMTSAFLAEGVGEREAFMLAVKSTALGLVSIDHKGEPDPEGLKNIFQQAESYFLA